MLELLWIILIGTGAGVLAKFALPGSDPGGFFVTALLGIGGAVVVTLLGEYVGLYGPGPGAGNLASVIGAILVLLVYPGARAPH